MSKYIIIDSRKESYDASFKAVDDIKTILIHQGFEPIYLNMKRCKIFGFKYLKYFTHFIEDMRIFCNKIEKGSIVAIQIPVKFPQYILLYYLKVLKKKKCKIIGFVHDIEQLRYKSSKKFASNEVKIFNFLDEIIVHNEKMKNYFTEIGITEEKLHNIEIFDYLAWDNLKKRNVLNTNTIVIAGNLSPEKAGYIYKMDKAVNGLKVKLYGNNYVEGAYKNIEYCGKYPSNKLPSVLSQECNLFGLVWDGDSIDECTGMMGKYQMYNNPHKLSLYLASGLPVIVWNEAAISLFVKENNVGICVKSLTEIGSKIENMPKNEIEKIYINAFEIGNKLREGYYTKKVVNEILKS